MAKTWLLPIASATYGYALTKRLSAIALLGALAVVVFGLLDANYLKQERPFRKLYEEVGPGWARTFVRHESVLAAAESSNVNYWPDWADIRSWAVLPFYGPLLLAGLGIAGWLLIW